MAGAEDKGVCANQQNRDGERAEDNSEEFVLGN